ncbi:MAG TPA: hypothetical protein VN622_14230 [Clostridia bacterium]|nr:hypothetical protein [Clostridia bacterium]
MEMSLEELKNKLDEAVRKKFGTVNGTTDSWKYYVVETFDDYVIARGTDGELFQIPYSVDTNEEIQLGDAVEVETAYVPVANAAVFLARDAAADDPFTFSIQVMKAGFANGHVAIDGKPLRQYFPPEVVAEVAAAVNGARFGRRHPAPDENEAVDATRTAGWCDNGGMSGDAAIAQLHLLKSETQLQAMLSAARDANKLDLFGISALGFFGFRKAKINGEDVLYATKCAKLTSVDLCAEAAAGGKFLDNVRLAASAAVRAEISRMQRDAVRKTSLASSGENHGSPKGAGRNNGDGAMKEQILKLLAALRKVNATSADELNTEFTNLPEDKHTEFLAKVAEAIATLPAQATAAAASATESTVVQTALAQAQSVLADAKKIQSAQLVATMLAAAKLPVPAADLVRSHLKDRVVEAAEIEAEITSVRTAFAAFSNVGRVGGNGTVLVGLDSTDKVQLAMDQLLGVKESAGKGVTPFRGLRDAYGFITGDRECRFGAEGGFLKVSEAVASTDFPNILANSMTKRALQDYAEVGKGGIDQLYTVADGISDFKTQDRVRDGYFGDIPIVAENGPYTELAKPTDEKIQYVLQKRGGLLTISEETIRNDDLQKVKNWPGKIVRAYRRTLKQFITNLLVNNVTYDADTVALFHASHNNLGSTALSATELAAREIILMKQTEKDSGKPLGLRLAWLVVPIDLMQTAIQINQNNEGTNPFFHRFGANNERIIVNELMTDANDWYYGADKNEAPCIEIAFLDGVEEPQILIANDPRIGLMLTNDQIVYKVKGGFGGDVIDFRGIGKNVVA